MPLSLPELLASARQMLAALTANSENLGAHGADQPFLQIGQNRVERVQALEAEQDMLKAALETKTAELESAMKDLKDWHSEGINIVRLAFHRHQHRQTGPLHPARKMDRIWHQGQGIGVREQ